MDLSGRRGNGLTFVLILVLVLVIDGFANANVVFNMKHKFGGKKVDNFATKLAGKSFLGSLKEHDVQRHGRMLAAIDFQLGGNGLPTDTALYYTKLSIGTPAKDYYVQMDTGSDNLWINCAGCEGCPTKSNLGIKLTRYDLSASSTGKTISCHEDFCSSAIYNSHGPDSACLVGSQCGYAITYGDGSKTAGDYVKDNFRFDKISGDLQTSPMEGILAFGCSSKQFGDLGSSTLAVDGIVGFGQANSSILSQLAASGKSRKIFSHCLDSVEGGGIFAIGEVVEPKVKTTPMVPDMPHYNAFLEKIEVGSSSIFVADKLTDDGTFGGGKGGKTSTTAIIDSGTTLAYLPIEVYDSLMSKLMSHQPGLKTHTVEQDFQCISYSKDVDDGFPVVSFHFENSAILKAYPHDYLFKYDDLYCFGWQNKAVQTSSGEEVTLLGDLVLSDKLIVYDVEKQTIGWTEYNCSSSIKVKDEQTGKVHSVVAHDISSSTCILQNGISIPFFLLILVLWNLLV
ncbi:hypothetical protein Leryth_018649 [Lithospermum erythrorhizon]|nr:hypothetical protein Leryth_018649 [Lithospermum erythrorhizon]